MIDDPEPVDLVGALRMAIDAAKARRAECRHEDSLYGRCESCGKTWAEQAGPECPACDHPRYLHADGGCTGYHRDPDADEDQICGCGA